MHYAVWIFICGVNVDINPEEGQQHHVSALPHQIQVKRTPRPLVGPSLSEYTCPLLTFVFEFEHCTLRVPSGGLREKWK